MKRLSRTLGRAAALVLAGCQEGAPPDASPIRVEDAWVRGVPSGNTAAYMTITSVDGHADRLLELHAPDAARVELHRTRIDESGLARMEPAGGLQIGPGESVRMEPGGLHAMLFEIRRPLAAGDTVVLSLLFAAAGEVRVRAPVRAR